MLVAQQLAFDIDNKYFYTYNTNMNIISKCHDLFEKQSLLLCLEYSDTIEEKIIYHNRCAVLFESIERYYVDYHTQGRTFVKLSDFKYLRDVFEDFRQVFSEYTWMDESDPTYPKWRYYLESK